MRRPPYHRDDRGRLAVKMTPMIDVIFLLLIFFVATAGFQRPEETLPTNLSLPGTLPETVPVDSEWEDLDDVVVKILWRSGEPRWQIEMRGQQVNERTCSNLKELAGVLAAVARVKIDLPVIIDPEGDVPMEHMIDAYDVCRQTGLKRVRFAVSGE
jgi:biopolymer transport protein ExbD